MFACSWECYCREDLPRSRPRRNGFLVKLPLVTMLLWRLLFAFDGNLGFGWQCKSFSTRKGKYLPHVGVLLDLWGI